MSKIKKDKIIIIDLEATCWRGRPPKGMVQEIIEIGVVNLDLNTGAISNEKGIVTIPTKSKISWFCEELTTINDSLVKKEGIHFDKACKMLIDEYNSKEYVWASWDNFDKKQFLKDCKNKNVEYPLSDKHINLMPLFTEFTEESKQFGVKSALNHLCLGFEGCHHRGVDDAYNTARIGSYMTDLIKERIEKIT